MANAVYNQFKNDLLNKVHDMDTDVLKVCLVTSGYTPNIDTHKKLADIVVGSRANDGSTSAALTAVTSTALSIVLASDKVILKGKRVTWAAATITAAGAVLYNDDVIGSSADALIAFFDFSGSKTASGGDFVLKWASESTSIGNILQIS
jgi:hypothetical protein